MSFAFMPLYTGDYLRDTRHLTPLRHGVYLLLLMHCWDQRGPAPLDEQECAGVANCRSADEIEALRYVLARYFVRGDDGYYNVRMQREVTRAEVISEKRSVAGLARHGLCKTTDSASAEQVLSNCTARGATPTPTLTSTAVPKKTHSAAPRPERSPRGSRLPLDWQPDATLTAWTTSTRPDLDQTAVLAEFRDYWAAIPGQRGAKLDWPATWRNWIRRTGAAKRPGTPYDPIATAHEAMRIMAARAAADADQGPTP
ncbi:MAG TPA: YdaU family protein [Chthonomonadales bacterium]|nr:YdaU family protein [Chthonomonadales bacterium]